MATFDLENFHKELEGLIEKFGNEGKIFSNEEQFQFELALAIEHHYQKDEKGYPKVRLEVLSFPEAKGEEEALRGVTQLSKQERDKMYTDIVVDINDSESIAIELKYKTLGGKGTKGEKGSRYFDYKTQSGTYRVFNQGASNLGCAYYLADVARIEKLIKISQQKDGFNGFDLCHPEKQRKVVRGFAAIISNDKAYWTQHAEGTDANIFSLSKGDSSKEKGKYKKRAREGKSEEEGTQYPAIELDYEYEFSWEDYFPRQGEETENPEFCYLLLEIPPQKKR